MFVVLATLSVYFSGNIVRKLETQYLLSYQERQNKALVNTLSSTLIDALLTEDVPLLQTSAEQYKQTSTYQVFNIRIFNEEQNILYESNPEYIAQEDIIEFSSTVDYEGETFGYITIIQDHSEITQEINIHARNIQLVVSAGLITSIVIILLCLRVIIVKPVKSIIFRLESYLKGQDVMQSPFFITREFQKIGETLDAYRSVTASRDELLNEIASRQKAEEALEQAYVQAHLASDAKSVFLANMSHELRTPLNAIIGYTEIVTEELNHYHKLYPDKIDTQSAQDLTKVTQSATHLLGLINDVLDFSKIEAGKIDVSCERLEIEPIIHDVISVTDHIAKKNKNNINYISISDTADIYADYMRTKQILLNLVSNACKFTHKGTITINTWHDENYVTVKVTDTGIGIHEKDIKNLFQEFTQLDMSSRKAIGGTGLGLVISRKLAHVMRGDITVESQYGQGSSFILTLPICKSLKRIGKESALKHEQLA